MSGGRITVLVTSPRVAPGLLRADAWDLVRAADRVLTADPSHPQRGPVSEAGAHVTVVAAASLELRAGALHAACGDGSDVVWLADPEEDVQGLADEVRRGSDAVQVVEGSHDLPGARVLDLVAAMDAMRRRCPWDARQTHESLLRYLLEETYETIEAVEAGDREHVREELGDLLLQVVFHARIAEEQPEDAWGFDEVAAEVTAKMVRRHPHVFGDTPADQVDWEADKRAEKQRSSAVDGVPPGLPALALADKVLGRVARSGLPVEVPAAVRSPGDLGAQASTADTLGELLLGVVEAARADGLDPEQALRAAVRRLSDRVRELEDR